MKPVTDSQFLAAKAQLGHCEIRPRGQSAPPQNIELKGGTVKWTCSCGFRNHHTNTGRGVYFCESCGMDTQLKLRSL